MNGWKYEWVGELPIEVYEVLLEEVTKEAEQQDG
jgi:hypothetical protein